MQVFDFVNIRPVDVPEVSCVYKIVNLVNDKVYVGQTINLRKRYSNHKSSTGNRFICRAIRKYGIRNFTIEILELVPDYGKLDEIETKYIQSFQSTNPNIGYNLTDVPMTARGHLVSEETRERLREFNRIRASDPKKNPMYGKKHRPESIQKMKDRKKERGHLYRRTNKPVVRICTKTGETVEFKSRKELASVMGTSKEVIGMVIKRERNPIYKGYILKNKN